MDMQIQNIYLPGPLALQVRETSGHKSDSLINKQLKSADQIIKMACFDFIDYRRHLDQHEKKIKQERQIEDERRRKEARAFEQERGRGMGGVGGFFSNMLGNCGGYKDYEHKMRKKPEQIAKEQEMMLRHDAIRRIKNSRKSSELRQSLKELQTTFFADIDKILGGNFIDNLQKLANNEWLDFDAKKLHNKAFDIVAPLRDCLMDQYGELSQSLKLHNSKLDKNFKETLSVLKDKNTPLDVIIEKMGQLVDLTYECLYSNYMQKKTFTLNRIKQVWKKLTSNLYSQAEINRNQLNKEEIEKISLIRNKLNKNFIREGFIKYPGYHYMGIKVKEKEKNYDNQYTPFDIVVDIKTQQCLSGEGWLTSSVITNFTAYLKSYYHYNSYDPVLNPHGVCILNQSQTRLLVKNYKEFMSVYRNEYGQGLFTKFKRIGLTINRDNYHWYFAGVDTVKRVVSVYDSISVNSEGKYVKELGQIMGSAMNQQLGRNQRQMAMNYGARMCQQQSNSSDCGVWTLYNMLKFITADNVGAPIQGAQKQVRAIRIGLHFMLSQLMSGKRKNKFLYYDRLAFSTEATMDLNNYQYTFQLSPQIVQAE